MIRTEFADHITLITLDRPEKLNAFAGTMRQDLRGAVEQAAAAPQCRVIVITGAGRAFSAGGDVEIMASLQDQKDLTTFRGLLEAGRDAVLAIIRCEKPVIAAINGIAAGAGCNLALACDYRIASDQAKLVQSFVKIGLHPDWGGSWFLPRTVGRSRAFELLTTGRSVAAAEALALGLVDRVVAHDRVMEETMAFATEIASGPPVAVQAIKRALTASERSSLEAQLAIETEHQLEAFASRDAGEGIAAFREKRAPRFSGE